MCLQGLLVVLFRAKHEVRDSARAGVLAKHEHGVTEAEQHALFRLLDHPEAECSAVPALRAREVRNRYCDVVNGCSSQFRPQPRHPSLLCSHRLHARILRPLAAMKALASGPAPPRLPSEGALWGGGVEPRTAAAANG